MPYHGLAFQALLSGRTEEFAGSKGTCLNGEGVWYGERVGFGGRFGPYTPCFEIFSGYLFERTRGTIRIQLKSLRFADGLGSGCGDDLTLVIVGRLNRSAATAAQEPAAITCCGGDDDDASYFRVTSR